MANLASRLHQAISLTLALGSLGGCTGEMAQGGASLGAQADAGAGADAATGPDAAPPAPRLVAALDASLWTKTLTDADIDCFWAAGYRHLVIGTQDTAITREQIAIATRGGFTIDLYTYLYWDRVEALMTEARAIADAYPQVGRMWLDIEESPGGLRPRDLAQRIDLARAVVADRPNGIYSGQGFWKSYMGNTDAYADVPLWYSHYDENASMAKWLAESFGGWTDPVGKQWDDNHPATCGRAVDKSIMWITAAPEVVVDRTAVDDGDPPAVPDHMWPDGGETIETVYVRPTVPTLRDATSYDFELEVWTGSAWTPYWAPSAAVSSFEVYPTEPDRAYRWRVRGVNAHGAGRWSPWAWFGFGAPSALPPDAGN